jgi:hypothetical protein
VQGSPFKRFPAPQPTAHVDEHVVEHVEQVEVEHVVVEQVEVEHVVVEQVVVEHVVLEQEVEQDV